MNGTFDVVYEIHHNSWLDVYNNQKIYISRFKGICMCARKIKISGRNIPNSIIISLLDNEAPKTCDKIWANLPMTVTFKHAINAGEQIYSEQRNEDIIHLEPENWVNASIPGDVGYGYSHWNGRDKERGRDELSEIAITYGRNSVPRLDVTGSSKLNLFGQVEHGLKEVKEVAADIRKNGYKDLEIKKATSKK